MAWVINIVSEGPVLNVYDRGRHSTPLLKSPPTSE